MRELKARPRMRKCSVKGFAHRATAHQGFPAAGQRIINTRTPLRAPTGQLALQHTSCQPPEVAPGDPPGPIGGHGQLASCAQRCRALTTSQPKLTNLKTGSYLGTDSAIFSDWSVNRPRGHAQKRSCGL